MAKAKHNKKLSTLLMVVLLAVIAIGGMLAYLQYETETADNVMTMGNVKIEQIENFDKENATLYPAIGDLEKNDEGNWINNNVVTKTVTINNNGESPAYVRTWFAFEMGELDMDTWKSMIQINVDETAWDWTGAWKEENIKTKTGETKKFAVKAVTYIADDGILAAGNTTAPSLKQVALHKDATNEIVEKLDKNLKYEVLVCSQAIQVEGFDDAVTALKEGFGETHPWTDGFGSFVYNGQEFVTFADALAAANAGGGGEIILEKDAVVESEISVSSNISIKGNGFTVSRKDGFTGTVFNVGNGSTFTLENVTVDGGANWTGDIDPTLQRGTTNSGVTATGNLIKASNNTKIILNKGAVLQDNAGAHAVDLGTRIGATLEINDAEIINNQSDSGAIWGGGDITMNSGKINGNSSTGSAGAIRMVGQCDFTMNGGEMNHNKAAADGGAIWGYGVNGNTSKYELNGGEIAYNEAGGVGGAIYTGTYSEINFGGTFEVHNNTASDSGAFRLTNYTILNMTGGKIYDNVSTNNPAYDGFYGWCPRLTISGGELDDNITIAGGHTPTIGGSGIKGIVYLNVGTNHNTTNLTSDFGTIKFKVVEDNNFDAFNLKPASDYTYIEGDENKLVCMNEGYETYWDAVTGTFKIKNN